MNLDEAVDLLRDSVLHAVDTSFEAPKLHRAILGAGNEFCREVACTVSTAAITLVASTPTFNPVSTVSTFEAGQFIRARVGYKQLRPARWSLLLDEMRAAGTSGWPDLIGFAASNDAMVYPPPDAQHLTLHLTYRAPFTVFSPGTAANPVLNIPADWVYDVIWWGAKMYLLRGLEAHQEDAAAAGKKFQEVIDKAKPRYLSLLEP